MNKIEIAAQRELDNEILQYVRGMEQLAPVVSDGVFRFLHRGRTALTQLTIEDRLSYLVDAGLLARKRDWVDGGELVTYRATAKGRDVLDGVLPPPGWSGS